MVLSVLLQLSDLSPQGGQLPPVAVSVLPQLGQLCADEELEAIACGTAGEYGYEMRCEARRNIQDADLRESINVKMTEEEQRWYDYDIKSGM